MRAMNAAAAAASDVHQQNGRHRRIRLVVFEFRQDTQLVTALKLPRVALLAGFRGRDQLAGRERRGYGLRVSVPQHGDHLARTIHLRRHESGRAGDYMAVHAGHVAVRAGLIGDELRLHDVAGLPAELIAFHLRDGATRWRDR